MEIISRKEAIEKGLKFYFTGNPCSKNHTSKRRCSTFKCLECERVGASIQYHSKRELMLKRQKEQYEKHKEKRLKKQNEYAEKNRKNKRLYDKKRHQEKKQEIMEYKKQYRAKNPLKAKEIARRYYEKTIQTPNGKAAKAIRSFISRITKEKTDKTESILGYTKYQLIQRIEFQFKDGMTWDNHGRHGWHLDHKKPISRFLEQGITDPKIINALSNLQPLWASENLSKGAKF